jgi:hypothetical protein
MVGCRLCRSREESYEKLLDLLRDVTSAFFALFWQARADRSSCNSAVSAFGAAEVTKNSSLSTFFSTVASKNTTVATIGGPVVAKNSALSTFFSRVARKTATVATFFSQVIGKNYTLSTSGAVVSSKTAMVAAFDSRPQS